MTPQPWQQQQQQGPWQHLLVRKIIITFIISSKHHKVGFLYLWDNRTTLTYLKVACRDVPVIHPVPSKCRISHYLVLPGPGKIMGLSNKKKLKNFFFLLFSTVSKKSYGIVDKNILCRIKNIQSYKLVFCFQYFLIFTVSCSSCHSLKSVSRTLPTARNAARKGCHT